MKQDSDDVSNTRAHPLSSDEFKALIDAMKGIHDGLFDRGFKISAALAGVLGWFAVKPNPLPQLCGDSRWVDVSITVLLLSYCPVIYLYMRDYRRARNCEQAFVEDHVRSAVYAPYRLTPPMITVGLLVQLAMFIFVGASIYLLYGGHAGEKTCPTSDKAHVVQQTAGPVGERCPVIPTGSLPIGISRQ